MLRAALTRNRRASLQVLSAATLDHAIELEPAGLKELTSGSAFFTEVLGLRPLRDSCVELVSPAVLQEHSASVGSVVRSLRFCATACMLQRFSLCMRSDARQQLASAMRSMQLTRAKELRSCRQVFSPAGEVLEQFDELACASFLLLPATTQPHRDGKGGGQNESASGGGPQEHVARDGIVHFYLASTARPRDVAMQVMAPSLVPQLPEARRDMPVSTELPLPPVRDR